MNHRQKGKCGWTVGQLERVEMDKPNYGERMPARHLQDAEQRSGLGLERGNLHWNLKGGGKSLSEKNVNGSVDDLEREIDRSRRGKLVAGGIEIHEVISL